MQGVVRRPGFRILAVLALVLAANGALAWASGPSPLAVQGVLAADETITDCSAATGFVTFADTLDDVQTDGGGTITFTCSGTITFTGQETITEDVTIIGSDGGVVFSGSGSERLFLVQSGGSLTLEHLTVQNGVNNFVGGAIYNNLGALTITGSTFINNRTTLPGNLGGAIYNVGPLSITDSTFTNNSTSEASSGGGAIYSAGGNFTIVSSTFSGNSTSGENSSGGAIYNSGTLRITDSTISDNHTSGNESDGGAILNSGEATITSSTVSGNHTTGSDSEGGAIYNIFSSLTIIASTFAGNFTSGSSSEGGAIYNILSTVTITASTMNDNRTTGASSPGGAIHQNVGTSSITTSIVAGNTPENCFGSSDSITSNGSNLSDDTTCNFTNADDIQGAGAVINLGPLADNGGPTLTMLPQADSHAIGNADCTLSSVEDQRGVTRPTAGTICTIGAVEVTVLCVSRSTGALSAPGDDGCGPRERALVLPGEEPVTLCIRRGTGAVSVRDGCPSSWDQHVVPDDGPFEYCVSRHTGALRAMPSSGCASNERPGTIPG